MTLIAMVVAGVILSVTPALAAPPGIEDFCFAQIEKVRPPLSSGRGDREAFMANCIADPCSGSMTRNIAGGTLGRSQATHGRHTAMLESEGDGNSLVPPMDPEEALLSASGEPPVTVGLLPFIPCGLLDTSPLSPEFARSVLAGLTRPRSVARPLPHQKRSQTSYGDQEAYCEWDRSPHRNLKS